VNDTAIVLLLFVAAGLLLVLGNGLGRARGQPVSSQDTALMAGMTGVAVGFLSQFLWASPLALGPMAIAAILATIWWRRGQVALVGALLVGGGLIVAAMQGLALLNDLSDPAVTIPGWTPVPLAIGVALVIVGTSLGVAGKSHDRRGADDAA
jgi:hypothetical protein